MRHEVAEDALARHRTEESPRERAPRVGGVAGDELRAVLAHLAEGSRRDQPRSVLDGRRLPVVETDDRPHACARGGGGDIGGLGHGASDGLLAPEVLARSTCGQCDLTVEAVRCSNADRLHLRVGDHVTPIGRTPLVSELVDGCARARFGLVGGDDEPGLTGTFREVVANTSVRRAVHPTHPAEPDEADADRTHHGLEPTARADETHRGRRQTRSLRPPVDQPTRTFGVREGSLSTEAVLPGPRRGHAGKGRRSRTETSGSRRQAPSA